MKILFMGTPEFAVPCLEACMTFPEGEVIGVFTQPDRPKGRGHKLAPPPVKIIAEENNISVYQPERLKTEENVELIRALKPDLIVVVAYGQILSKAILEIPPLGCINVHGSLLPQYRGASPIQWSIVQGENETGVTTMYMAEGLDTGDMIDKCSCVIGSQMTAGELHDTLMAMGASVLKETLNGIFTGTATRTSQVDVDSSYAPILTKEMAEIDWTKSADAIHNHVRGFNPWPVTHTIFMGERMKVFRTHVEDQMTESSNLLSSKPGTIVGVDSKGLKVLCGKGTIVIESLQVGAGKRMEASDYLRGHAVEIGTILGL